jgi:hypothetical protein
MIQNACLLDHINDEITRRLSPCRQALPVQYSRMNRSMLCLLLIRLCNSTVSTEEVIQDQRQIKWQYGHE